jgi:hypothetical protein
MRRLLTCFIVIAIACSTAAFSQIRYNYQFVKAFPDTNFKGSAGAHGIAVDPEGKVWVQLFNSSDSIVDATSGNKRATRVVYCFNRDGTPAPFSPIKTVTVAGKTDTLYNSSRGMRADHQGNILFASFDALYRLNYRTGAGMAKILPQPNQTQIAPGVDAAGEVFAGLVIPGVGPLQYFDANFNLLGNVTDTSRGFSRAVNVSKDGNDVYWCGYTNNAITRYHSDFGSLGPYSRIDTVCKGLSVESIEWHPKTGYLWVGSGNAFNAPNAPYSKRSWYAFAPPNYTTPVDSFKWFGPRNNDTNDPRPRGMAFSVSGDTVYVCQFNDGGSPAVQMFVKGSAVNVEKDESVIPAGFTLSQNYPNPFNPTTQIKFTIEQAGMTSLKVYDMLGREVATLVEESLAAGGYTATFDASRLSSGVYAYVLTSRGYRLSNKMVLLK